LRRPFISGNWKMNLDRASIAALSSAIKEIAPTVAHEEVGIYPPYPYLAEVVDAMKGAGVSIGGQDLHYEKKGAFTSQISGSMLKDVGASHVLVGHSERRDLFGDTNEICCKKIGAALDAGLVPVLCLGEHLPDRQEGKTSEVVLKQASEGLKGFSESNLKDLVIAYEPVWAIGTGVTATPEQAEEAHKVIRDWIASTFSREFAEKLRILYGGSVTPDNVDTLMAVDNVDGALVGGASLKPESFLRIMKFVS